MEVKLSYFVRENKGRKLKEFYSLYVRIQSSGKYLHNLKLKVLHDHWNVKKSQPVIGTLSTEKIKKEIAAFEQDLDLIIRSLKAKNIERSAANIKLALQHGLHKVNLGTPSLLSELVDLYYEACARGEITNKQTGGKLADGTILNYKNRSQKVKNIITFIGDLDLKELDIYQATTDNDRKEMEEKIRQYSNQSIKVCAHDLKMAYNTGYQIISYIKIVLNWAGKRYNYNLPEVERVFNVGERETPKRYVLPEKDFEKLIAKAIQIVSDYREDPPIRSKWYRGAFYTLMCCLSSARITAIRELTIDDIVEEIEEKMEDGSIKSIYSINNNLDDLSGKKMYARFTVPKYIHTAMMKHAEIFEGFLCPAISTTRDKGKAEVSGALKVFHSIFPDLEREVKERVLMLDGTVKVKKYNLADHIQPHMYRRTSITNMIAKGVPDGIIKQYSGHSSNSKAYGRYHGDDIKRKMEASRVHLDMFDK